MAEGMSVHTFHVYIFCHLDLALPSASHKIILLPRSEFTVQYLLHEQVALY